MFCKSKKAPKKQHTDKQGLVFYRRDMGDYVRDGNGTSRMTSLPC